MSALNRHDIGRATRDPPDEGALDGSRFRRPGLAEYPAIVDVI